MAAQTNDRAQISKAAGEARQATADAHKLAMARQGDPLYPTLLSLSGDIGQDWVDLSSGLVPLVLTGDAYAQQDMKKLAQASGC